MSEQNVEPDTDEAGADGEEPSEPESESLVARIAAHDESLAALVADRGERLEELEAELDAREERIDELESRLKRERADFQNYKKRAKDREATARRRATADVLERLLDVRDNLLRALEQDSDADIRDGVEATLAAFDDVLDAEDVAIVDPDPGEAVDPAVHEVVMRVEGDREAGTIEDVYRVGYAHEETVLRPAQVAVSEGDADTSAADPAGEPADSEADGVESEPADPDQG